MCVNYIHYYPAGEVEVCKSAVSNATLHSFFAKLGVHSNISLIQEKYLSVNWTPAKIGLLRELYHVSPLNVACLNHAGQLFPGHPTNWSKVSRPDQSEGNYNIKTRDSDECFATNN